MFEHMDKKISTILRCNFLLNWPYGLIRACISDSIAFNIAVPLTFEQIEDLT